MAKGKAKINGSALLQPRSLRSRKRECLSEEISETVQASRHQQDTEGSTSAVDTKLLQSHPTPVQESTILSTRQHEAEGLSSLTKQDPDTYEKHSEATPVEVEAFEDQEETAVANHNNVSQPEEFKRNAGNEGNNIQNNQGEMTAEECNRSQTCTDQLQVFLAISEEGDKSALDEQMGAKENSQCDSEKKQEAIQARSCPSNVNMADVKELTKEAAAGLPAKKKRRMAGSVTEEEEPDIQLESSHCGGEETGVLITVTTSDGTSAACDPMGESCEVEGVIAPGAEQTADTKSDPPPTEEEELLENPDQQEPEDSAAEIPAENPQEPIEDGEDGSAAAEDQSPAITFYSNPTQNEETENGDAMEAAVLQVNSDTRTSEKKEELTGGAGDGAEAGASPTDPQSGGSNTVKLCEAAAPPSGSERKDSVSDGTTCDGDKEHSAGSTEPLQTWDTTDPFGSGYLDYVTDSQLNTISLSEVDVMEEEDLGSPDHEDATELICGLIRELSSLNRKVMATHRDLENLRRSSKTSRSSTR
ncbi:hypothetical protein CesoFtcFv8_009218 [Champsocephalus esox]|uniref:Uncharacterized protein n=1 Tax=Champsocephalus esox TaxID=159716 RepID=A0AAN8H2D7_9TELE|nr:hypothetical protein CesoFtcFv8_009218 [Champsocephalus esox]